MFDNETYQTSYSEEGNAVVVKAKFRDEYLRGKNNYYNESDIYWQIFVPANTEFIIETINADVTTTWQKK